MQFAENTLWFATKAATFLRLIVLIDSSSSTGHGFRHETLASHNNSRFLFCVLKEKKKNQQNKTGASAVEQTSKQKDRQKLNTAHFTAEEKLALTKFPTLCVLQEKNVLNISKHYRNLTACKASISPTLLPQVEHYKNFNPKEAISVLGEQWKEQEALHHSNDNQSPKQRPTMATS